MTDLKSVERRQLKETCRDHRRIGWVRVCLVARKDSCACEKEGGKVETSLWAGSRKVIT